jgi:hypothetical protein
MPNRPIYQMSTEQLGRLLEVTQDEELMDEIYDELERRREDLDLMDWREQDARAAAEERIQLWREEY